MLARRCACISMRYDVGRFFLIVGQEAAPIVMARHQQCFIFILLVARGGGGETHLRCNERAGGGRRP